MNYRHAFHAGNFADVFKHAVLTLALERLAAKSAPFFYLDTHAGAARYDLGEGAALRTGEAQDGVVRLAAEPSPLPSLRGYLKLVRALNERDGPVLRYPGSPWLARKLLRPQDRLLLCELRSDDARELRRATAGDRRVEVREADGWQALKSDLPPRERRGLILIDPPFEASDEYERLVRGLRHVQRRFATGVVLGWYPIKNRAPVDAMLAGVTSLGFRRAIVAELQARAPADEHEPSPRLTGCGMIIVNPPWTLSETLAGLLPWLARVLAQGPGAGSHINVIAEDGAV
ncbi:MAG: 23S rRNA (adenine(2030)-N(6))-methyltransferase RlmJ [Alphaproteobacteria bacterium]|nr:23S rRNA (adenine(2030)-N(6))-methyltransferase RlmJ [Alphaproteobacteria bacterium]